MGCYIGVVLQCAVKRGAVVVCPPWEESDSDGMVRMARIQTYGDTTHTLIERTNYSGSFLPGYQLAAYDDPLTKILYGLPFNMQGFC